MLPTPQKMLISVSASTPVRYHNTLFISSKKSYLATSQLAQLGLTDIKCLKSFFLKQYSRSWTVLPLATAIFKSEEEEWKEPTELAKFLHFAIFHTGKSNEMCKELFFMHWFWISTQYRPIQRFGYWNWYWEGKSGIWTALRQGIRLQLTPPWHSYKTQNMPKLLTLSSRIAEKHPTRRYHCLPPCYHRCT